MVHVHGAQVQQLVAQTRGLAPERLVAVPIDVGKGSAAALVCDFTGELLVGRFHFALTRVGVAGLVGRVQAVQAARPVELVRVGIEAAGHYHRPLSSAGVLPADWQLVEYNPAHVAAQRRTNGQRGVKTDAVDLAAIADLLVAGRGLPVGRTDPAMVELAGLVATGPAGSRSAAPSRTSCSARSTAAFLGLAAAWPTCWGPRSGGCWSPSSPTRPASPTWDRPDFAPSPPAAA